MTDCLFCKIVNNEIPCNKIYEDDKTLAFLDIMPVMEGHCLIIPKQHSPNILETPEEDIKAMFETAKKITPAIMKATNSTGININSNTNDSAGQKVMHTHIHLLPRKENDNLKLWPQQADYPKEKLEETTSKIKNLL